MKLIVYLLSVTFLFAMNSCNSGGGDTTSKDSTAVAGPPKTILKTTKEYKTNLDGNVETVVANVEVAYNEKEVNFIFKEDTASNLNLKVTSVTKDSSGVKLILDDRKYQEVFITSGKQPQVRLSTVKGTENVAFM
jgi:hypothetical protein